MLQPDQHRGIEQAISQRLPAAHIDAFTATRRNQAVDRGEGIEVLDDDAGIEDGRAVIDDQAGHLGEGVELADAAVRRPDIFGLVAVLDLLLGHHDAHLAHERAGV